MIVGIKVTLERRLSYTFNILKASDISITVAKDIPCFGPLPEKPPQKFGIHPQIKVPLWELWDPGGRLKLVQSKNEESRFKNTLAKRPLSLLLHP